jgi:cobalt-precorrin-6B (C15)-methyltransferase
MRKLRGGPTQDEVMAIALQKLGMRSKDHFADIGCGTGKVSVAASKVVEKVYAIDLRPEAVEHTQKNIQKNRVKNMTLLQGNAVEFLSGDQKIDCAFVGGSKDLDKVLVLLKKKEVRKVVVTAVMISTLHRAIEKMRELDMFQEAVMVQVSRSKPIVDGLMFKPIDPVYIIVGGVN